MADLPTAFQAIAARAGLSADAVPRLVGLATDLLGLSSAQDLAGIEADTLVAVGFPPAFVAAAQGGGGGAPPAAPPAAPAAPDLVDAVVGRARSLGVADVAAVAAAAGSLRDLYGLSDPAQLATLGADMLAEVGLPAELAASLVASPPVADAPMEAAPAPAPEPPAEAAAEDDDDARMARELQAQFDAERAQVQLFPCMRCEEQMPIEALYSLDLCSHRFCRPCLSAYFLEAISTVMPSDIKCPSCDGEVSIRDVQDFTRNAAGGPAGAGADGPVEHRPQQATNRVAGSADATRRLMRELRALRRGDPEANGMSVELVSDDNLYEWEVSLFNFDGDLGSDLQRTRDKKIVLRVSMGSSYPLAPPYVRVIRPRFQFRTGHVTVGGSICTEALTSSGWDPSMTIESVLYTVRANMDAGGGRLDLSNRNDYTAAEAKEAFDRMKRFHGW